jgi:hypothetical protein
VGTEGGADTGFSAVAVEVQAVLLVALLVGNAGNEVGGRSDFDVVAGADLPLVNLMLVWSISWRLYSPNAWKFGRKPYEPFTPQPSALNASTSVLA